MTDLQALLNNQEYLAFARSIRPKVRGLRRRGLIAALHSAIQASGNRSVIGVEVGVKFGTLSQQILESLPQVRRIVLVDPWKEYPPDHSDRGTFGYASRDQAGWDRMARMCEQRLAPFGKRAKIMRTTSLEAAEALRSQRFYFAYVDAGHSFDDVLADCKAWWPLIEPGGVLAGDDYTPKGSTERRTESVSSAVETFAGLMGLPIISHHRNWLIEKPR